MSTRVFVGNIPRTATPAQLRDVLREVGSIDSLTIVTDKATGTPTGYAYCTYHNVEAAKSAIRNLSGRELCGRTLRVDVADALPVETTTDIGALARDMVATGIDALADQYFTAVRRMHEEMASREPSPADAKRHFAEALQKRAAELARNVADE